MSTQSILSERLTGMVIYPYLYSYTFFGHNVYIHMCMYVIKQSPVVLFLATLMVSPLLLRETLNIHIYLHLNLYDA
jgi:hypothetical protein